MSSHPTDFQGSVVDALRQVIPAGVLADVGPLGDVEHRLYAEERQIIQNAVAKRRQEFATGRVLAHALLGQLGVTPAPLLRGEDRSPQWPKHILGSISHSAAGAAVVVGRSRPDLFGIGVDLEACRALDKKLHKRLLTAEEQEWLAQWRGPFPAEVAAMAMFSLKEALFKCMYPLGNQGLRFQHVSFLVPKDQDWGSGVRVPIVAQESLKTRLPEESVLQAWLIADRQSLLSFIWCESKHS